MWALLAIGRRNRHRRFNQIQCFLGKYCTRLRGVLQSVFLTIGSGWPSNLVSKSAKFRKWLPFFYGNHEILKEVSLVISRHLHQKSSILYNCSDCSKNLHAIKTIIITIPKTFFWVGGFSTYFFWHINFLLIYIGFLRFP